MFFMTSHIATSKIIKSTVSVKTYHPLFEGVRTTAAVPTLYIISRIYTLYKYKNVQIYLYKFVYCAY